MQMTNGAHRNVSHRKSAMFQISSTDEGKEWQTSLKRVTIENLVKYKTLEEKPKEQRSH